MNIALPSSAVLLLGAVALAGCADRSTGPTPAAQLSASAAAGVPFSESLASSAWQALARGQVPGAKLNPVAASRVYATLAVADYRAVQAVEKWEGEPLTALLPRAGHRRGCRDRPESERGARPRPSPP